MPVYEYRCENGHTFEVLQRMSDDPVSACEECGAPVQRVFHPVAVHFKGSGFYTTDYGRKKGSAAAEKKETADGKKADGAKDSAKSESGSSSSSSESSKSGSASSSSD
jgi:putative FmdB family regulatory protein